MAYWIYVCNFYGHDHEFKARKFDPQLQEDTISHSMCPEAERLLREEIKRRKEKKDPPKEEDDSSGDKPSKKP